MMRLTQVLLLALATVTATAISFADEPTKLPEGHPEVTSDVAAGPALPKGHPPIGNATTMPARATGRLTIKAIAKSKDGPSVASLPIVIHFYTNNKETKHTDAHLDDRGMAIIKDIELTPAPTQAMVSVDYSGVVYDFASPVMNSAATEAQVDLPVYATTTQPPDWRVVMRHVMIEQQAHGMRVVEMIAINNPSDHTWVAEHDGAAQHATVMIRLPQDAGEIDFGEGFTQNSARLENQTLYYLEPIVPGSTRLQFAYTIPVSDGKARLPIVAPAITKQLIVMMPDDGTVVQPSGLTSAGLHGGEKGSLRMYQTSGMDAGSSAYLTIAGIKQAAAITKGGLSAGQIALACAAGAVLVIGTVFMLMKPAKTGQKQG